MIERKKSKNRKCPDCSSALYTLRWRNEDDKRCWSLECPKCGDVTKKFFVWNVKNIWSRQLEDWAPAEAFAYSSWEGVKTPRLACTNCLTTYGHPVTYCVHCNGKTERREISITTKEWLKRSPNNKEYMKRFRILGLGTVQWDLVYPELTYDEQINKRMEILGITP